MKHQAGPLDGLTSILLCLSLLCKCMYAQEVNREHYLAYVKIGINQLQD